MDKINKEEMMQLKKSVFFNVRNLLSAVVMVLLLFTQAFAESGNVDGQNGVDLRDAVIALQICAGMNPANVDINGEIEWDSDDRIGLEEAVFILRQLAVEGKLQYIGELGEPDDYADTLVSFEDSFPDTAGNFEGFVAQLPESFDWRDYNAVTRSKDQGYERIKASLDGRKRENQGYCGSCWAFAAVAAFESKILIAGGPEYNLSEQQQVSCNTANFGCCGGYISAATFWQNRGPMPESCTDYDDFYTSSSSCNCSWPYSICSNVACNSFDTCEELPYRVNNYHSVDLTSADEVKISITQYGPGVFRYDFYDDFYTFWNGGSNGQVYVQSSPTKQGGHAVAIIGYDDAKGAWLCKNSWGETGPNGDGTFWIAYTGHKNNLKFKMTNFSVSGVQPCEYSIYPSGQSFNPSAGTGSISITATTGCSWSASDNADWISITSGNSGNGNGTLNYAVNPNSGTGSRTGIISVAGKTFSITQSGMSCSYAISPVSLSVNAGGGTGSVNVTATGGCQWSSESNETWITIVSGNSKIGDGVVNYQVAANPSADSRTGTMTIAGHTFTITQSGMTCSYSISPESKSVSASGGTGDVAVTASTGCGWTADSNVSWISVTSGSNGDGNATVSYSVNENTTIDPRTGTMTIAGKTFTVTQEGQSCSYTISPMTMSYDLSGGTGSLSVVAPSGCIWTATESLDWVTITAGESGDGNGTVSYTVSENTGGDPRIGTMSIGGKTFTVTQGGSSASVTHPVPDTAQTRCYDTDGVEVDCAGTGQDGEYSINPASYTRLDGNGNPLSDTASSWAMVKDDVTGLVWEAKESYEDRISYNWYDPNPTTNGGYPGLESSRDTLDFITEKNTSNYGGYSDWRLPTRQELRTIINYGVTNPAVNIAYFPYTFISHPEYYWTSVTKANLTTNVWIVSFTHGIDYGYSAKGYSAYIRAVRGGQLRSFDNWSINGDGTVSDPQTGLTWEIKTDDGGNRDKDNKYTWQEALDYCNSLNLGGHSDWRLPSINELVSMVDLSKYNPAVNMSYFPKTVSSSYWSSSSCAHPTNKAWFVQFGEGSVGNDSKSLIYYVRAVRGGKICSYNISPTSTSHDLSGGTGSISVTASAGCTWTVMESLDWFTITAGASGDGNGTVSYTVSENTGTSSRTGTITIAGKSFTITQSGSSASFTHPIPDTGQTLCYDTDGVEIDCTGTGQDGEYSINPASYTKLDNNGNTLSDTASSWAMVKDNVTGLIWERKQGYEDAISHTWYDPNPDSNGAHPGFEGTYDTLDFITEKNTSHYGGYSDWRLPTRQELRTIIDYSADNPATDIAYFPYTFISHPNCYWTSETFAGSTTAAYSTDTWRVQFSYGRDYTDSKGYGGYIRSVRGGQPRSFDNWIINGDGTVSDPQTGLTWEIKTDDGGDRDKDNKYTWQEALDYCNNLNLGGHSDWRLPNINELSSLVDLSRYYPAVNTAYLPKTVSWYYWSSTSRAHPANEAWFVHLGGGGIDSVTKISAYHVRAVRGGQ